MKWRAFSIITLVAIAGCSKGVPKFEQMDSESIPQPRFAGSTNLNKTVLDPNALIAITGTCDASLTGVEFRLTAGATTPSGSLIIRPKSP